MQEQACSLLLALKQVNRCAGNKSHPAPADWKRNNEGKKNKVKVEEKPIRFKLITSSVSR